jgi:hypothetical protein
MSQRLRVWSMCLVVAAGAAQAAPARNGADTTNTPRIVSEGIHVGDPMFVVVPESLVGHESPIIVE